MKSNKLKLSIIASSAIIASSINMYAETLNEVVVKSDFREKSLAQTSNSITVLGEDELYDKASQSFIDTISNVPNVNFSAGASKAKYIQIRGIGERSQYETPINPSVGLIVDGIDFSSSTLGANLFDVNQVEVLRGPQGTTFGANALAGVITVESNKPTKHTEGHIETTIGNYNSRAIGAAIGGTLIENKLLGRFSVYKNASDGYMTNSYLNKKNTNNIDELTTKAQFTLLQEDNHTIDFNIIHTDVDNGYDAFTFDNSRNSISDEPGNDTQKTNALSVKSTYSMNSTKLITTISTSKTDMLYSFDEDWSNPTTINGWAGTDEYIRDKKQTDIDMHLLSKENTKIFNQTTSWTFGLYNKNYYDKLARNHSWNPKFNSNYNVKNNAIYGQLDTTLSDKLVMITGLRAEEIHLKYSDSSNFSTDNSDTLTGNKLGFNYQLNKNSLYYLIISKGYKPGGVNANNSIPNNARTFKNETLWNLDLGVNKNYLQNTLTSRFNIFYGERTDQQVKSSFVTNPNGGGAVFNEYFNNAAKGYYYGIESQIKYTVNDDISVFSNIGLLESKFKNYIDPNPVSLDVNGRAPAQSPSYQYNIGLNYLMANNWYIKTDVLGKGSYYFSNRHNEKAKSYKLFNTSTSYIHNDLTFTLWAKNITNKQYQTRGFGSFGNNPANGYTTELYTQQGSPRTFGATLGYDF